MSIHHTANEETDQLQYEHYAPRHRAAPKPVAKWKPIVKRAELPKLDSVELTRPTLPPTQPMRPIVPSKPPSFVPLMPPILTAHVVQRRRPLLLPLIAILVSFCATLLFALFLSWQLLSGNAHERGASAVAQVATPTLSIATFPPPTVPPELLIQPWDGKERFTILLLGLDKRPYERGTAFRTDSMILISLDPATRSIGVLSIPRDLYVEIPRDTVIGQSYGFQRINTAYYLGERVREGYGPLLAMQAVQYNLGIRIHDYIVFDFQAVIAAIDAIGGIEIDVPRDIIDREYPDMYTSGYDPLYIRAGRQWMNGELALKYARSRHDSSDFDRARRQQQIIAAIRERILGHEMLPTLLLQASNLWAALNGHVRSGLTLEQWIQLALYAKDVPSENIRYGVLNERYVQSIMWNGMSVLSPNRAVIGNLLVEVFGENYNR
ncbi:MAG: LCP family protein [Anaerolineae bacterium]|nr:LCP family protein [Anaerolineae bacterium]